MSLLSVCLLNTKIKNVFFETDIQDLALPEFEIKQPISLYNVHVEIGIMSYF